MAKSVEMYKCLSLKCRHYHYKMTRKVMPFWSYVKVSVDKDWKYLHEKTFMAESFN